MSPWVESCFQINQKKKKFVPWQTINYPGDIWVFYPIRITVTVVWRHCFVLCMYIVRARLYSFSSLISEVVLNHNGIMSALTSCLCKATILLMCRKVVVEWGGSLTLNQHPYQNTECALVQYFDLWQHNFSYTALDLLRVSLSLIRNFQ